MAKTKVVSKRDILSAPTEPLTLDRRKNVAALLEKMRGISFQGRNLAIAYQIWRRMLGDRVMIMMGMSGAMVPAGMRRLVVYMLKNLVGGSDGDATATTVIHGVHSIPEHGWYINVHRTTDLSNQTGFDPISCGNVED